jgi:predicted MFS family arabinose efflux permease
MPPIISQAGVFTRGRPTLLSYSALAAYTFWLYGFGPALALLRDELHFSYTMIGIYSAVWAGGSVMSAATFAAAASRIGRRPLLWWSAVAATADATIFATTHTVALTLTGTALLGFAGTTLQTTTQSVLADVRDDLLQ